MPGGFGDAARGAGTGAAIGSFIPGVGTLIGGGIGALGGWLFGGDDDDKKKDDENAEAPYQALLQESSQNLRGIGGALHKGGTETIGPVIEYLKGILGNNPQLVMEATRADRGRVMDQYDTARRTAVNFGPRGGGLNSSLANSQFQQAESLADITSDARRGAMATAASLGTTQMGLGLSAEQLASADLGTVINSVLAREGFDVAKRGQTMDMWGGIGEAAGTILGGWLAGRGGKGGTV